MLRFSHGRPSLSLLFTEMLAGTSSAPLLLVSPDQTHVCAQRPLPVLLAWPHPRGLEQGEPSGNLSASKPQGVPYGSKLFHTWSSGPWSCSRAPPVLRTPHQNSWMSVGSACKPTFGEITVLPVLCPLTRGIHPPSLPAKPTASHSGEFDPYRCSPPVQHP